MQQLRPYQLACGLLLCAPVHADLFTYLAKPEPTFAWKQVKQEFIAGVKVTDLRFTSQVWQTIQWNHLLRVFEPAQAKSPGHAMLLITGGNGSDQEKGLGVTVATMLGAPFAILYNIPNQPLFEGRKEDALIAYTFARFLETGDESWPLLFPMTKSAVKAMDVLQAYSHQALKHFVITGASKRGWTTWFCGVADPRVEGIAPIVYDNLDLPAQMRHQMETWGAYSEQIHDYTALNLPQLVETEAGARLARIVDPFTYRKRITVPKLVINGTNDPYWPLDALNLYWDKLVGSKHLLYVPNKGHDVGDLPRLLGALSAFFQATVAGETLPEMTWNHETKGGKCILTVTATPAAQSGTLWVAYAKTKDFRPAQWKAVPMQAEAGKWVGRVNVPADGFLALFGELTFGDRGTYRLSTQVREVTAK